MRVVLTFSVITGVCVVVILSLNSFRFLIIGAVRIGDVSDEGAVKAVVVVLVFSLS